MQDLRPAVELYVASYVNIESSALAVVCTLAPKWFDFLKFKHSRWRSDLLTDIDFCYHIFGFTVC